jgi:DNA-binding NarL/FixJ family response regulator
MLRILVADDHSGMRRCMRDLLDSHESWEVCAEAATGRQAVELTVKTRPDIVVLDLSMPRSWMACRPLRKFTNGFSQNHHA